MDCIHVKNLEKYHPGYQDRKLRWAKIFFDMVQGDPDCEMIENEIDWARFVKFIILELQAQKPIPLNDSYLSKKGFDLKKRPISLTIQMLHNFLETVTSCYGNEIDNVKTCSLDKSKSKSKNKSKKLLHNEFVYLFPEEYEKLKERLGQERLIYYIGQLNNYIGSKGKRYKSHYHTILNWSAKEMPTATMEEKYKAIK